MKHIHKYIRLTAVIFFIIIEWVGYTYSETSLIDSDHKWRRLDNGLELGFLVSPQISRVGDSTIHILRIDPKIYKLQLYNLSAIKKGQKLTAKEWSKKYQLIAAINAAMYQKDHKTSVSLMRTKDHINNSYVSKDKSILAFDRRRSNYPLVKIIDQECDDFNKWSDRYFTLIQSIRMISCSGKNVWSQQPAKWSTAAIGIDDKNRVLFIHARSPYSTHDFINILLSLPVDITRAMYVEGGPEAQLYIHTKDHEFEFLGRHENDYTKANHNNFARPIPNIIGIKKRIHL